MSYEKMFPVVVCSQLQRFITTPSQHKYWAQVNDNNGQNFAITTQLM